MAGVGCTVTGVLRPRGQREEPGGAERGRRERRGCRARVSHTRTHPHTWESEGQRDGLSQRDRGTLRARHGEWLR